MNMLFNEFLVISNKISRSFSFLTMKTLIQNIDLTNNAFNEFLIISNKMLIMDLMNNITFLSFEVYLETLNH